MGIFTRFRDIINSNISSMLDNAEDPEKLIRLMIREMEDTLVEIKASCAGAMASAKKVERQLNEVRTKADYWNDKARLAVDKGRDDLAREALMEKRQYTDRVAGLEAELADHDEIVKQYKGDILLLEDKLKTAREKQRILVQRQIRARRKKQAHRDIRRIDSTQAVLQFEELENRIDRMESEADLVNYGKQTWLRDEFDKLEKDDDIEKELAALKQPPSIGIEGSAGQRLAEK